MEIEFLQVKYTIAVFLEKKQKTFITTFEAKRTYDFFIEIINPFNFRRKSVAKIFVALHCQNLLLDTTVKQMQISEYILIWFV